MRRPTWSILKRNPVSALMLSLCLTLTAVGAVLLAVPANAQPTEYEYHRAAIDYAVNEQAAAASHHNYPLSQLWKDAYNVGMCENGLKARSSSMYLTSWQHHPDPSWGWENRLRQYENWIRLHNSRNPNQQIAMPQRNTRTDLDPLTGARVTIWWMLNVRGGTWRGTGGWPSCGWKASR